MCGIVFTTDIDDLIDLMQANSMRGTIQYSASVFDENFNFIRFCFSGIYDPILMKEKLGTIESAKFYIGHLQSPTGAEYVFHPAVQDGKYLYHNGMMKEKYIQKMKAVLNTSVEWDTELMLMMICRDGLNRALNSFEGSFACILVDALEKKILVFRNQISPMYADTTNGIRMSSTSVDESFQMIPANTILKVDIDSSNIYSEGVFNNTELPYYFA